MVDEEEEEDTEPTSQPPRSAAGPAKLLRKAANPTRRPAPPEQAWRDGENRSVWLGCNESTIKGRAVPSTVLHVIDEIKDRDVTERQWSCPGVMGRAGSGVLSLSAPHSTRYGDIPSMSL